MIDVLVAEMMDETLRTMIDTTQHVLAEMIDEMQHMVDEKIEMISATWRKAIETKGVNLRAEMKDIERNAVMRGMQLEMIDATWRTDTVIMETDIETIDEGCERVKAITSAAAEKQRPQDD